MVNPDEAIHSFVVRIWLEKPATPRQSALWRGHVTHVHTGQRRHFDHLEGLTDFIRQYLQLDSLCEEE